MKFLAERPEDEAAKMVWEQIRKESISQLKKGIKVDGWKMRIGHDGDDFIKNWYTVACFGFAIKIPRFVRNYLLKKKYEVRRIKH